MRQQENRLAGRSNEIRDRVDVKIETISPAMGIKITGLSLIDASDDLLTHPSGMHPKYEYVQVLASKGGIKGRGFSAWHSDMTWHPTPPAITMLYARTIPKVGGDTGFANQQLAWQMLDNAARDKRRMFRRGLVGSEALMSLKANHTGKGFGPDVPDSIHPVVRQHEETGELALFVNPEFTSHIVDVSDVESQRILWPLWLHQTNMEFIYRHCWLPGDLVIWDNRSVLHTAILDYEDPRDMIRVVVKGATPKGPDL